MMYANTNTNTNSLMSHGKRLSGAIKWRFIVPSPWNRMDKNAYRHCPIKNNFSHSRSLWRNTTISPEAVNLLCISFAFCYRKAEKKIQQKEIIIRVKDSRVWHMTLILFGNAFYKYKNVYFSYLQQHVRIKLFFRCCFFFALHECLKWI